MRHDIFVLFKCERAFLQKYIHANPRLLDPKSVLYQVCSEKKKEHTWYKTEVARNFKPIIFSLGLIVTFTNRWLCYQSCPLPPITLSLSLAPSPPSPLAEDARLYPCMESKTKVSLTSHIR